MSAPTLVVMAAGIGSRYGGLKQIDPIGPKGEIILDYSVYDALRAGFEKVVFIIREEIEEAFKAKLAGRIEKHVSCDYVFQKLDSLPDGQKPPASRTKPWGTGHAVLCCKEAVSEPFAVINADDFYGADAYRIVAEHLKQAQDRDGAYDICMAGFQLGNTITEHGHVARGVCSVSSDGHLVDIVERTRIEKRDGEIQFSEDGETWTTLSAETPVSMNLWGFTPGIFGELESRFVKFLQDRKDEPKAEFFIPTVVNELLTNQRATVKVLTTKARWVGVTYKEDLPGVKQAIREMIAKGEYPEALWAK